MYAGKEKKMFDRIRDQILDMENNMILPWPREGLRFRLHLTHMRMEQVAWHSEGRINQ